MTQPLHHLKTDRYRQARGGNSKILNLYCTLCGSFIVQYQKDGPGSLIRMYLDRIIGPAELLQAYGSARSTNDMQNLLCPGCQTCVATPMLYLAEKRLALRVRPGSLLKHSAK